jgi:hypothetical protein
MSRMWKQSCLISCSQPGPEGGTFAGDGRHGSIIPSPGRVRSRNNIGASNRPEYWCWSRSDLTLRQDLEISFDVVIWAFQLCVKLAEHRQPRRRQFLSWPIPLSKVSPNPLDESNQSNGLVGWIIIRHRGHRGWCPSPRPSIGTEGSFPDLVQSFWDRHPK